MTKLIYGIELRQYNKNEVLFKRGDHGEHFYIIFHG